MDTLLENGDHKKTTSGLPSLIFADEELIQQAMIRLCCKKGSFKYDSHLGSNFYTLAPMPSAESLNQLALTYAQQALAPMVDVSINDISCRFENKDSIIIKINLLINNKNHSLEVSNNSFLR